ncbi:hypothetical protein FQZ97_1085140 [compost metagenome]
MKWARESIERERGRLAGELRDLAAVLGLDESATASDLTSALRAATRRLAEDAEITRLRNLFERIQQATADGMLPLPGEQLKLVGVPRHA